MKTITEQIAAVEREIKMRHRVYPRWIESDRMTQKQADYEIACMESVLETLRAVEGLHGIVVWDLNGDRSK